MILITGATKGIGRAVAEAMAETGHAVIAVARSARDLRNMKTHWENEYTSDLRTLSADLSQKKACQRLVDQLERDRLVPTVIIHNVGTYHPGGLTDPADPLPEMLALNLLAAHRLTRGLLPGMLERGGGHLVTIGSVATVDFPSGAEAYTVSKYALEGWHRALSQELADTSIRTTLIQPGATLTASWDGEDYDASRILSPDRVAQAVRFALESPSDVNVERIRIRPPQ